MTFFFAFQFLVEGEGASLGPPPWTHAWDVILEGSLLYFIQKIVEHLELRESFLQQIKEQMSQICIITNNHNSCDIIILFILQ